MYIANPFVVAWYGSIVGTSSLSR